MNKKYTAAALELSIVLLVTQIAFVCGKCAALLERRCTDCGGEYLSLLIPVIYYCALPFHQGFFLLGIIRRSPRKSFLPLIFSGVVSPSGALMPAAVAAHFSGGISFSDGHALVKVRAPIGQEHYSGLNWLFPYIEKNRKYPFKSNFSTLMELVVL